jgi:hypothetical protein
MRFVVVLLLLAGCAKDVRTRYPSVPGEPVGSITLVFTRPSPDVYVAINGRLVVDGAHTSHIRVDGVATGFADVALAVGPGEKQVRVWVEEGRDTVLPIGAPGGSMLDSLKSMAMSLAAIALYAWIR